MAWSIVGSATGTNTATMPTHQIGDSIFVWATRDGSNTAPTLVSGYTNINNGGANTFSHRLSWKRARTTTETVGTHTNATSLIVIVIRNGSPGLSFNGVSNNGTNGTFNYAALTMNLPSGAGGLLGFVGSVDGTSTAAVNSAPTNMTNQTSVLDATDASGAHYQISATAWASTNVTANVTATWRTYVLEIVDETPAANIVGNSTMNATGNNMTDVQAWQFTVPTTGTINKIRVFARHKFTPGSENFRVAVYNRPSLTPDALLFESTSSHTATNSQANLIDFSSFTNRNGTPAVTNGDVIYLATRPSDNGIYEVYNAAGLTGQEQDQIGGLSAYPTWPDPMAEDAQADFTCSIWAEITPSAGTAPSKLALLGVG